MHLQQSHPEWKALKAAAQAKAQVLRRTLTKPCPYCLETRFDLQHHWKQCYMITLLSFLECRLSPIVPPQPASSVGLSPSPQYELSGREGAPALCELHDAAAGHRLLPTFQETQGRRFGGGHAVRADPLSHSPGHSFGDSIILDGDQGYGQREGQGQEQRQRQADPISQVS